MLLIRAGLLAALSLLFVYMLYRAEARLYPMEKTWETPVPVPVPVPDEEMGKEIKEFTEIEKVIRKAEAAQGLRLDGKLAAPDLDDPFLLGHRWTVQESDDGKILIRLTNLLRPVGFLTWLRWKASAERRYAEAAREKVRQVKRQILSE